MKQFSITPPHFKTISIFIVLLSCTLHTVSAQNYDPFLGQPSPTGGTGFGPPFILRARVFNFAPLAPLNFNGFNDVNVSATQNAPGVPFYNQCLRVTSTQNIPGIGNSDGWYVCEFLRDDDGSDLMQFTWNNDNNPMDGVTTFDVVQIRIAAASPTQRFANPYSNIAADVLVNGVITAQGINSITPGDAEEVAAFVLGIIPDFTQVPSWRFVPTGHIAYNAPWFAQFVANPFATSTPTYPGYLGSYNRMLFSANPSDYSPATMERIGGAVGVKMGDVNFSNSYAIPFAPPPVDRSEETYASASRMLRKGTIVRVTCTLNDSLRNVVAWQTGLHFDNKKVNIFGLDAGDLPGFGKNNYNIMDEAGELRALWIQPETKDMDLAKGTQMFDLVLELQKDVQEGDALLTWDGAMEKGFYRLDGNRIPMNTERKVTILSEPLAVSTNPNPFKDFLLVKALGGADNAQTIFTLLDVNGREVAQKVLEIGQAEASIQTNQLPGGMYLLKTTNLQQSQVTPLVKL